MWLLAATTGMRHSELAGLRTVEPEVVTAWEDTTSDDRVDLARRSRVSATLVRLILDGFPPVHPHAIPPARAARVKDLWRAGAPWDLIAELTEVAERAPSRPESGLALRPERWSPAQAGGFLGWSSGRIYQHPRDLPPPDGSDGDRVWWWSTTIERWAESLNACPTCDGRFPVRRSTRALAHSRPLTVPRQPATLRGRVPRLARSDFRFDARIPLRPSAA